MGPESRWTKYQVPQGSNSLTAAVQTVCQKKQKELNTIWNVKIFHIMISQ